MGWLSCLLLVASAAAPVEKRVEVLGLDATSGWLYFEEETLGTPATSQLCAYHVEERRLLRAPRFVAGQVDPFLLGEALGRRLDVRSELRSQLQDAGALLRPDAELTLRSEGRTATLLKQAEQVASWTLDAPVLAAEAYSLSADAWMVWLRTQRGSEARFFPAPKTRGALSISELVRRVGVLQQARAKALAEDALRRAPRFTDNPSRFFRAAQLLRSALAMNPQSIDARVELAALHALDEDADAAVELLEEAARLNRRLTVHRLDRPEFERLRKLPRFVALTSR